MYDSKKRIIYLQEDDLNLDTFGKKKKKKKKDRLGDADGDDADDGENKENGKFIFLFLRYPWIYRNIISTDSSKYIENWRFIDTNSAGIVYSIIRNY